ncbi:hypothetical protein [Flavisolibacter ginsenosidimutans]|uniref:Helix-turn-helix transcriptional regulator n=1 Tax=Flavisolibacter ginsenosidimutans TaxID=661481 RepID=A0A5B8UJG6_9BACT|nr:hypothetical protein [Flavisolibacter ginsenosidimutans]QEC56693.1 hypothetical protein FSB75_12560 [Flavisolibacter ginsenosidimutans]
MAKNKEQVYVKYKYALAFKLLLDKNKKQRKRNDKKGVVDMNLDDSYGKISSTTGLRPATLSEALSGLSEVKATTIDLILNSLGASYAQFGKIMDNLTEEKIIEYKKLKEEERTVRATKRG